MSQKGAHRSRRLTNDEEATPLKVLPQHNENDTEISQNSVDEESSSCAKIEQNGTEKDTEKTDDESNKSRSQTPEPKIIEENDINGHDEVVIEGQNCEEKETEEEELEVSSKEEGTEMMEPLIISDEPDPELVFDENSDLESGKSSPVLLNRCKTRRSLTRNVPTPKTPKSMDEDNPTPSPVDVEIDNKDVANQELNVTFDTCSDNWSTKAEVGGDSTRFDHVDKDTSSIENNSFIQATKNKSFGDALRHLSTRRTIRPISNDYRKRLLQTKFDKNSTYPRRNSVERISIGSKRKNIDSDDEDTKRFKNNDSSGFLSKFSSPLNSIKNTFRSDIPSSTPKLTGYKDEKFLLEDDSSKLCEVKEGEKRWCSIM